MDHGFASPRVVVGVPLHNNAAFFPSALESWLGQTYREFVVLLVDDASDDGTADLATALASREPRVAYVRHERRVGMCANWRSCVSLARERYPEASYFAWGSDHDLWHRDWLERMVEALDGDPDAVLAFPLAVLIDDRDEVVRGGWKPFDTAGVENVRERLGEAFRSMKAGNIVYGLYRLDALARIGGLRNVLGPDQLLMYELALSGTFRQVRERLWMRRARPVGVSKRAVLHRQRRSLFVRTPLYAYVPYALTHVAALWWLYGVRGRGKPDIGRGAGLGLGAELLRLHVWDGYLRKRTRPVRKAVRKRLRTTWIRTSRPTRRAFRRTNRRARSVVLRLAVVRRLRGREPDETKRAEIN